MKSINIVNIASNNSHRKRKQVVQVAASCVSIGFVNGICGHFS